MLSQTYHPLNNGARIPAIGFGCAADGSEQYDKILHALKVGYRSIDTAEMFVPCALHVNIGERL
jgi:diketogulonate reductase-like aldo/keto reductase